MNKRKIPNRGRKRVPMVVGLTGGVGSGKSLFANVFKELGAIIISGDDVGHDVVDKDRKLQRKLAAEFGQDILRPTGINRNLLASKAFSSPERRSRLNELVHPALIRELNRRIDAARRSATHPLVVVDAALLVEWGGKVRVDFLIAVRTSKALRMRWLKQRGWSENEIEGRMKAQLPFTAREAIADLVIRNDGDKAALRRKALRLWQKFIDQH